MTSDPQTERALVGLAMVADGVVALADPLPAEAFTDPHLRSLWRAIRQLDTNGQDLNPLTIATAACGGDETYRSRLVVLSGECIDGLPRSSAAAAEYADRLRELHTVRRLAVLGEEVHERARAGASSTDLRRAIDAAIRDQVAATPCSFMSLSDSLRTTLGEIEERQVRGGGLAGVGTGFSSLDQALSGFRSGCLVIVGARPGTGKTAFALQAAANVARQRRGAIAFLSLEMPRRELNHRLLAEAANVPLTAITRADLAAGQWDAVCEAARELHGLPLHVDDAGRLTTSGLRTRVKRLSAEGPLALVVVDYLQLVVPDRRRDARAVEVAEVSASLKALAKELDTPVLALSQLSRAPESRDGRQPRLSDLRDSGALEQDADAVVLLHRPELGLEQNDPARSQWAGKALAIVAKNRQGPLATIPMRFMAEVQRFTELRTSVEERR